MDTAQKPERGRLKIYRNDAKKPGDKLPMFVKGFITKPGENKDYPLTLWAFEYTNVHSEVKVGFNGAIGAVPNNAPAMEQIQLLMKSNKDVEALLAGPTQMAVKPGQIVLFTNPHKENTEGKNRPDFYGYSNFGDGTPLVAASVWAGETRYKKARLTGATQFPMPGKSIAQQQDAAVEMDRLIDDGAVSRGMPEQPKSRSRDRGR